MLGGHVPPNFSIQRDCSAKREWAMDFPNGYFGMTHLVRKIWLVFLEKLRKTHDELLNKIFKNSEAKRMDWSEAKALVFLSFFLWLDFVYVNCHPVSMGNFLSFHPAPDKWKYLCSQKSPLFWRVAFSQIAWDLPVWYSSLNKPCWSLGHWGLDTKQIFFPNFLLTYLIFCSVASSTEPNPWS